MISTQMNLTDLISGNISSVEEPLPPFTSKYGYNGYEMCLMVIITALTNIPGIPGTIVSSRQWYFHRAFIGWFVTVTSFMYHLCESIGHSIILTELQWHRLDNIGAICGIIEAINYIMHLPQEKAHYISWSSLILVMIVQEEYPWDIEYTIGPIVFYLVIMGVHLVVRKNPPRVNRQAALRASIMLPLAALCFVKGLDEFRDYLRFWHGLWHICITTSVFYLFQLYEEEIIEQWELGKLNALPIVHHGQYKKN